MTIEPTQSARPEASEAPQAASARRLADESPAGAPEQAEDAPSADVIDLSEAARELAAARAASDATTPERVAFLEQLRARIEAGTYEPDAEAIAREIVDRGEA